MGRKGKKSLFLTTSSQKSEILNFLRLLYQLVRNPADRRHFICTEAERDRSQVVIDVSGAVQV